MQTVNIKNATPWLNRKEFFQPGASSTTLLHRLIQSTDERIDSPNWIAKVRKIQQSKIPFCQQIRMPDIVLTTFNARYHHSAFGLRYLLANMGEHRGQTEILEFGLSENPLDVMDQILSRNPKIVGVGVYIWNVEPAARLVADLKRVRPDLVVVLGGPEVSYEWDDQPVVPLADYVVTGEADWEFPKLCRQVLAGERPKQKIISAQPPPLAPLKLPYEYYTDEDIANRVIYVEASRGCPFTCEFCLSALEIPVRQFPLDEFLAAMQSLFERGTRQFKFVDRTFNLNLNISRAILKFFLKRYEPGLFLHFEMIPDRLPESLRDIIAQFPAGTLQFEVGIQTFDDEVSDRISRRQDVKKLEDNLTFLRERTGVHVHADLIVGLPGEDVATFAAGFNRLVALGPQEIQVGMLKRLRGTPIVRHDADWQMVYSPHPPFEVLKTRDIDAATMSRLRRFAKFWDLIANSGNFVETAPLLWERSNPFAGVLAFADWLYECEQRTHGLSLVRLMERLLSYLTEVCSLPRPEVAERLWQDYQRGGRSDRPRMFDGDELSPPVHNRKSSRTPRRQSRHIVES